MAECRRPLGEPLDCSSRVFPAAPGRRRSGVTPPPGWTAKKKMPECKAQQAVRSRGGVAPPPAGAPPKRVLLVFRRYAHDPARRMVQVAEEPLSSRCFPCSL